jgi:hypothetical protein
VKIFAEGWFDLNEVVRSTKLEVIVNIFSSLGGQMFGVQSEMLGIKGSDSADM